MSGCVPERAITAEAVKLTLAQVSFYLNGILVDGDSLTWCQGPMGLRVGWDWMSHGLAQCGFGGSWWILVDGRDPQCFCLTWQRDRTSVPRQVCRVHPLSSTCTQTRSSSLKIAKCPTPLPPQKAREMSCLSLAQRPLIIRVVSAFTDWGLSVIT